MPERIHHMKGIPASIIELARKGRRHSVGTHKRCGANFNRMFNLLEVETRNFARLQRHVDDYHISLFLRHRVVFKP